MPIFKGNTEIAEIYHGNTEIAEIYHGSVLVYSSLKPGTVLLNQTGSASSTITIPKTGYYKITLVGNGGRGSFVNWGAAGFPNYISSASGGSGAGLIVVIKYTKNQQINWKISSPSQFSNYIAGNGTNASFPALSYSAGKGGQYTIPANGNLIDCLFAQNGNNGSGSSNAVNIVQPHDGGASVLYGWGHGGNVNNNGRTNGGIILEFLGNKYTKRERSLVFNLSVPATIKINNEVVAEDVTTYTHIMGYKDSVDYEIVADGYVPQSGSYIWENITATTQTINITLEEEV